MMIPLGILASSYVAPAGGGGPTFLGQTWDQADLTTYTFSSQSLGTPSSDRQIVCAIMARYGYGILSVTIGGVTATADAPSTLGGGALGIYRAAVPLGGTGDVVVTFSSGAIRCSIALWAFTGSATVVDYVSDTIDTLTEVDGGLVFATVGSTGVTDYTWPATLVEDFDSSGTSTHSGASRESTTSAPVDVVPTVGAISGFAAVAYSLT